MRISDWSSDVCSSDLSILTAIPEHEARKSQRQGKHKGRQHQDRELAEEDEMQRRPQHRRQPSLPDSSGKVADWGSCQRDQAHAEVRPEESRVGKRIDSKYRLSGATYI